MQNIGEKRIRSRWLGLAGLVLLALSGCGDDKKAPVSGAEPVKPLLLGAYYHPWFGVDPHPRAGGLTSHWQSYMRKKLAFQHTPVLGEYSCRDLRVIKQQLDWAKTAGIDFFAMNWFGPDTWTDVTIKDHFADYLQKTQSPFRFCIDYQTLFILESSGGVIPINKDSGKQLFDHFVYLANNYFAHPNYLKINGRPVVFMQLSRLLGGDYELALAKAKTIIKHQKEFDIFLVGDEVWWRPPVPQRLRSFDAVTYHNMQGSLQYDGYPSLTGFFKDMESTISDYKTTADGLGVRFIPAVMPGFNDRGLPANGQHAILPREASTETENTGATYRAFFQIARKFLDPAVNVMMITSFNEWSDDTQIEPVVSSYLTPCKHPAELTGGYNYYGYNDLYLNITREEKAQTGQK